MKYYFGKDITFKFYAMNEDGERVVPSSDNPSIYIYSESVDRNTVRNESGSTTTLVGTEITSWTESDEAYSFTIPAVDDPDPDSEVEYQDYYAGIRFYLQSSEQQQVVIRQFRIYRVLGHDEKITVQPEDLEQKFNAVSDYKNEAQQLDYIDIATEEVRAELRNEGFKWAYITEPRRLKRVVIDRALIEICNSEIASGNLGLEDYRDELKESYTMKIKSLVLAYDSDGDGEPDAQIQKANAARIIR